MELDLDFSYLDKQYKFIEKTDIKKWLTVREVVAISPDMEEALNDDEFYYQVFIHGRAMFEEAKYGVTHEKVTDINVGDIVLYQGSECQVMEVVYYNSKHPYFRLAASMDLSSSLREKIGKNPISYVLLEKVIPE